MKVSRLPGVKKIAVLMSLLLLLEIWAPTMAWALTAGPSQPEVQSFEPVGTTQMVDLQSGDFNYNIPLLSVGAYPINLAYHAGVGMEDEASWVGLGWNLNPGAINRNMRGLPDDFSGEEIKKELDIKDNITVEFGLGPEFEFAGLGTLGLPLGIKYNNYKGLSLSTNVRISALEMGGFSMNVGLGFDTGEGISITPSIGLSHSMSFNNGKNTFSAGINIGAPYNSRSGLSELTFTRNFSRNSFEKIGKKIYKTTTGIGSSGSLISFNTPSYIAATENNSRSYAFNLKIGIGAEILPFADTKIDIKGGYSKLKTLGDRTMPAYGYLYHHLTQPGISLMDFNREKDGPYYKSSNSLPLTGLTYDSYSITGQGVGGAYRPYRNDIGYIQDPSSAIDHNSDEFGGDIAPGIIPVSFKVGVNYSHQQTDGRAGVWSSNNNADDQYYFGKRPANNSNETQAKYEPTYFKQIGELTTNDGRYERMEKSEPLHFDLTGSNKNPTLTSNLKDRNGNARNITAVEADRSIRTQPLSALNITEAKKGALLKKVEHYLPGLQLNGAGRPQKTETSITDYVSALGSVKNKQLFELTVNRPDGARYVYGLPIYNLKQEEVIFNPSGGATKDHSNPSVRYSSSDLSNNHNGVDHYYSRESMPGYAYSHLLTSVLSSDYSDRTGDGLSDDDYGDWVKFNYTNIAGNISGNQPYKWRFPFHAHNGGNGIANFNEGLKSQSRDDKANYTYGEKDLWYAHSIESRSHIAIFYTSDRNDAKGVRNEYGQTSGSNTRPSMQKLDRIEYFAKNDLALEGQNAVPIKTVHFEYDYSLCPGVPNNLATGNGGKLTLQKIYFHYGNSRKGEFSKYQFGYFEDANNDGLADNEYENPPYKRRSQDRWGNYKKDPITTASHYSPSNISNGSIPLANSDFPYAEQDETTADENAQAWNLKQIELPSGGTINVDYEADDYAYVQDRRANQMFTLKGTAQGPPGNLGHVSTSGKLFQGDGFYNYLVVELPELLDNPGLSREDEFYHEYLDGLNHLYFRSLVQIKGGNYEFVPGYTKIESHGTFQDTDGGMTKDYGWIQVKGVGYDDNGTSGSVNPIAKAGWQFARTNIPTLVYPGSNVEAGVLQNVIQGLLGLLNEIPRMLSGFNRSLKREGFCKKLVPQKSWVKLNAPNLIKKGGGCRVKKISLTDNWTSMDDNGHDAVYGQQYFYRTVETTSGGEEKLISSGVATYEPVLGNDENPFKEPITFNESRWLAPDNHHYIEKPMGESFFPSATVGYSKVTVADIRPDGNINRTATGYSISEYYTARDFPYKTLHDVGEKKLHKPSPLSSLFRFRTKDLAHVSQGYTIELNDMHGKEKAAWAYSGALPYDEGTGELYITPQILDAGNRISGSEYIYHLDENNNLDNEVQVIKPDGSITSEYIGIESEIALDFRENKTKTSNVEIRGDLDMWIIPIPIFPIVIPIVSVIPAYSDAETIFKSAVTTKVVNKHGLLKKVRSHQEGSVVETENLLYDSQTGEVLLTSLNNEYRLPSDDNNPLTNEDDLLYNMKYPAHWAYEGMGPAYQNLGAERSITTNTSGNNSLTQAGKIYYPGDEVIGKGTLIFSFWGITFDFPYEQKFWVSDVSTNAVKFIFENGELLTSNYEIIPGNPFWSLDNEWEMKVLRSGHRNQQSLPIATMTSLKNPATYILGSGSTNSGSQPMTTQANALEIIDVSAQEYNEEWQMYCNGTEIVTSECVCDVDMEGLGAISDLLTRQYNNGELWTTQLSDIGAITDHTFPWNFDDSECAFQNQHYSTTDLSYVRTVDDLISQLKISPDSVVFASSENYDQFENIEENVMAYVVKSGSQEMIELAFHYPESTPSNSQEEVKIKRLYKPEGAFLNVTELIKLRSHDGSNNYALLYDFQDRKGVRGAIITVFDKNQVHWSRVFTKNSIEPLDISTYDIYSMYVTYYSPKTKHHHIMKVKATNGEVEYDQIVYHPSEVESDQVLPFIIVNKGAAKRDNFTLMRSAMVQTPNGTVNRIFNYRVSDTGNNLEFNNASSWTVAEPGDTTRFFPTDLIKILNPENGQDFYFATGKTNTERVFMARVNNELRGEYALFDPQFEVLSASLDHAVQVDELVLNISPALNAAAEEEATSIFISNLFEEEFIPFVTNVYRFDASNSLVSTNTDGFTFSLPRTFAPTMQINPINRTGKLRLGNYLEDDGHLSSLSDCFDQYEETFYDFNRTTEDIVKIKENDNDGKQIGVVLLEESTPDLEDYCCPESMTHFVSYSRECDTCSYTFYLPEEADYCLMDLRPVNREVIPVVPDYEEIENADCDATDRRFYTYFEVNDPSSVQHGDMVQVVMRSNCFEPFECSIETEVTLCGGEDGTVVNPYVHGVRGNWRTQKSYVHKQVNRVTASAADQPSLRNQGHYERFDQFWNRPNTSNGFWSPDQSQYIKSAEITKYSPYGEALEEFDALGIPSAILTGYDKKLPTAVGGNMKYREMAFDGFEEYAFYEAPDQCHAGFHFDLDAYDKLDQTTVHSGFYSLKVTGRHRASFDVECPDDVNPGSSDGSPFELTRCADCLPNFNPAFRPGSDQENRYVFDGWVNQPSKDERIRITQLNASGTQLDAITLTGTGPSIEGWRRVYGFFELQPGVSQISIVFRNNGAAPLFVDDVRVYPFDGNMKSFVYHPSSLKLMAELDENNHATFYEYDEEWNLTRVKKETERGIVTLQEHRNHERIVRD